jgi:fatty acid desaturase (delta-4 desaturase)
MAPQTGKENVNFRSTDKSTTAIRKQIESDTIQVDDKVYSAKLLASIHPGGELFIKAFAGRDATEAFLSYHRRKFPHEKMRDKQVGDNISTKSNQNVDNDFLELCDIIDKVIPRNQSFANFGYFIKIGFIITVAFGLEFYMHYTKNYKWYLTGILGLFMALIGLNIQHDANHGAISKHPIINRILGLTQNWIGGSAVDWIHQHVVQHHINCNDVHEDPDLAGGLILRLNPLKKVLSVHAMQHIYLFLLLTMFGFSVVVESFKNVITGYHFTPMSKLIFTNRMFEICTSLFFLARWVYLPYYQTNNIFTLVEIIPLFVVAGYYLAFFFVISHNFDGVEMFDKSNSSCNQSFLYKQVSTSSNVGGSLLSFLNGGLNYQIEHHLFPRISHVHYPKIAPYVKDFCDKKKIPYRHFPDIQSNVMACVKHLYEMGHGKSKF